MLRPSPAPAPVRCSQPPCAWSPSSISSCPGSLESKAVTPASCPSCPSIPAGPERGWKVREYAGRLPSAANKIQSVEMIAQDSKKYFLLVSNSIRNQQELAELLINHCTKHSSLRLALSAESKRRSKEINLSLVEKAAKTKKKSFIAQSIPFDDESIETLLFAHTNTMLDDVSGGKSDENHKTSNRLPRTAFNFLPRRSNSKNWFSFSLFDPRHSNCGEKQKKILMKMYRQEKSLKSFATD